MPNAPARGPKHGGVRFQGGKTNPADQGRGGTDRRAWQNMDGRGAASGKTYSPASRQGRDGDQTITDSAVKGWPPQTDGNLGMVGKPRKFLLFSRSPALQTAAYR